MPDQKPAQFSQVDREATRIDECMTNAAYGKDGVLQWPKTAGPSPAMIDSVDKAVSVWLRFLTLRRNDVVFLNIDNV